MSERTQNPSNVGFHRYPVSPNAVKMATVLTPKKTMLVLVIVVGCFAVLWPKIFYPMLVGSAQQHMMPSDVDKRTGCCDVFSETDVDAIKILSELCKSIIDKQSDGKHLSGKEIVTKCRSEVLQTCGIDISAVLQEQIKLGRNIKHILDDVRSLNGSLCLKYNYGLPPSWLGVPHRVAIKSAPTPHIRQERPPLVKSEMLHPAFREKGRAIPQPHTSSPAPPPPSRPPPRIVEGRPGPVPGMRPTLGGAGHVVPPSKQGTGSMGIIMPIYTIGIVVFFGYTLIKILFKKQPDSVGAPLYPPVEPDPHFRREVFESEKSQLTSRLARDGIASKLGDLEMDQLRRRLRETELAMERIVAQMSVASLKPQDEHIANGVISNGSAVRPHDPDQPSVTIMGMETRASCEGGEKWTSSESPVLPPAQNAAAPEPVTPPQEIFLEGALPAQSQLLVSDSATEAQPSTGEDPAVVLAGKMTLSVINLDEEEEAQVGQNIETDNKVIDEEEIQEQSLSDLGKELLPEDNKFPASEFEEPPIQADAEKIHVYEAQQTKESEIDKADKIEEIKADKSSEKQTEETMNISLNGQQIESKEEVVEEILATPETPLHDFKTEHKPDAKLIQESVEKVQKDFDVDKAETETKDFIGRITKDEAIQRTDQQQETPIEEPKIGFESIPKAELEGIPKVELEGIPKVELEKQIESLIEEAQDKLLESAAKPSSSLTDLDEEFERLRKSKEKDIEKLLHEANDPVGSRSAEKLSTDLVKEIASSVEFRNGGSKLDESLKVADINKAGDVESRVTPEKIDQAVEELLEENENNDERSEANTLQEVSNIEDEAAPVENNISVIEHFFQDRLNNLDQNVDAEEQKTDEEVLDSEEEIEYEEEDVGDDIEESDLEEKLEPITSTQDEKMNGNELDESKFTNVSSAAVAEQDLSERDKTEEEVEEDDEAEEGDIEEVIYVDDDDEEEEEDDDEEEEEEDEEDEEEIEVEDEDEIEVHPVEEKKKINHISTDRKTHD